MMGHGTEAGDLVPPAPREVGRWFFLRRMRAMAFCSVLFLSLGLGMGVGIPILFYVMGGYVCPTVDLGLDRNSVSATGVITSKEFLGSININSRHPWKVGFRFRKPGGVRVDGQGYTLDGSFAEKSVGDSIAIEYDPGNAFRARPVGGTAGLMPPWVYLLVLGLLSPELVGGGVVLMATWARARSVRKLLTYGASAEGEVTAVREVRWIHFGRKHPYDVTYQFGDHRGVTVTGRERTYQYDWAGGLKAGDRVGVVFNPHESASNVLWVHGGDVCNETDLKRGSF